MTVKIKTKIERIKFDLYTSLRKIYRKLKGRGPALKSKVDVAKIKKLMRKNGLAYDEIGNLSWFYKSYDRGDQDPLTNYTLNYICEKKEKNAQILVTGCGTGIMLFYFLDKGFKNVEGFDFLPECVSIANEIAKLGNYTTKVWKDDGFNPSLEHKYDLITAMHWVFSAWMGNYGNNKIPAEKAMAADFRELLLTEFFSKYSPNLNKDGILIVELTDAVADYRVLSEMNPSVYPVRFTPDQVKKCAASCELEVIEYNLSLSYGHQPRTSYILRKY